MSHFFAVRRVWLGAFIAMQIATAYGCMTAIAVARQMLVDSERHH